MFPAYLCGLIERTLDHEFEAILQIGNYETLILKM